MIYDFRNLRPEPKYPIYPPYHKGPYLEDFAFQYYKDHKEEFDKTGRQMIPVSWTSLYVDGTTHDIQAYLNALDQSKAYWTVSQHDDGIRQKLPPNTLHFAAGGLGGGIPIPLLCSPIPKDIIETHKTANKDIFCSFVGSITHPIRQKLYQIFLSNEKFYFNYPRQWAQTVEPNNFENFIQKTQRTIFALAPRGYGLSSFRLYEIMQLGAIPVYVSDKHWLPFTDELNWDEFCVVIDEANISNLEIILNHISPTEQQQMLNKGKEVYENYFTMEKVCENILKRL